MLGAALENRLPGYRRPGRNPTIFKSGKEKTMDEKLKHDVLLVCRNVEYKKPPQHVAAEGWRGRADGEQSKRPL
jgi:hypothetical protein